MKNIKILNGLSQDKISSILELLPLISVKWWNFIFKKWDKSNEKAYIIKSGSVEISISWKTITNLSEWEIIWEIALLSWEERTADVKALEDLELYEVSFDILMELANDHSDNINKEIINRIRMNLEIGD